MSDLTIIDSAGNIISEPRFKGRQFRPGVLHNLVRNRYQGSALAFRRRILKSCVPFPADIPLHDMWIGLVNQFVGKAHFIAEPLLFYRRHGGNESPSTHAPLGTMIRWRWSLVKNLVWFLMRKMVSRRDGRELPVVGGGSDGIE